MARVLFDTPYIFGIHEPGGENHMIAADKPGWIVFTEELGRDPSNQSSRRFDQWSSQGLGIICRLNHGYYPNGTLPHSSYYEDFAQRCANFVANSSGCKIWVIGNETNYEIERPRGGGARSLSSPEILGGETVDSTGEDKVSSHDESDTDSGFSLRTVVGQLLQRVLKFISQGMGSSELFRESAKSDESRTELTGNETGVSIESSDDDPFLRGLPGRFSALKESPSMGPEIATRAAVAQMFDPGEAITPELYARCYRLCRDAIHRIPGHENDLVLTAPVAPWNDQTKYAGNLIGDWIQYFADILNLLGANGCDGIALHTYTHQADPNLIRSEQTMNPPFQNRRFEFRTYRDFMNAIPDSMRHLPVYITETDQDVPWVDANIGWVQQAYGEIDHWNQQPDNQKIRALVLYRWPNIDRWVIATKPGVIADFNQALQHEYRWEEPQDGGAGGGQVDSNLLIGDRAQPLTIVRLRRSPGFRNKPDTDTITAIQQSDEVTIVDGPRLADGLIWWQVEFLHINLGPIHGWMAEFAPDNTRLLAFIEDATDSGPTDKPDGGGGIPDDGFDVGDVAETLEAVFLRRTAGFRNKPASDVLLTISKGAEVKILGGPQETDGLTWWSVELRDPIGRILQGWIAEATPNGVELLAVKSDVGTPTEPTTDGTFKPNDRFRTLTAVRMRRSPGFVGKNASDTVAVIPANQDGTVLSGPRSVDNLTWWQVRTSDADGRSVTGWMAESAPSGTPLLLKFKEEMDGGSSRELEPTEPASGAGLRKGDIARVLQVVRLRRSPGYTNKPSNDIVLNMPVGQEVELLSGPQQADNLTWWLVGFQANGQSLQGWTAEAIPGGAQFLTRVSQARVLRAMAPSTEDGLGLNSQFKTLDFVRLRRSPGYVGKSAADIVTDVAENTQGTIIGGPRFADGLTWWQVQTTGPTGRAVDGWMAEFAPNNIQLLAKIATIIDSGSEREPQVGDSFQSGDTTKTLDIVRMRRSPGYVNKAPGDVVTDVPNGTEVTILFGPQLADNLSWWRVEARIASGRVVHGWMAEMAPNGAQLLEQLSKPVLPPQPEPTLDGKFKRNDIVRTLNFVRLRQSPGFLDKPGSDIVADIWNDTEATILGGAKAADDLLWWQVQTTTVDGRTVQGWMAESAPGGIVLLALVDKLIPPVQSDKFEIGDLIVAMTDVRVRRSPGFVNKLSDDVLGAFVERTTLNVIGGPQEADGLIWWRVGGITLTIGEVLGWVAEAAPNGVSLLSYAPKLPSTNIPNKASGTYLGLPFESNFGLSQLWAENPHIYSQFFYDGVRLKGHNGIDYFTPTGTRILATDHGIVAEARFDFGGFGNYVRLIHSWGESLYAHLDGFEAREGQGVARGSIIGRSGNSGNSNGPHLHFAIRINPYNRQNGWGGFSDPLPYLNPADALLPNYVLPSVVRSLAAPSDLSQEEIRMRAATPRMEPAGLNPETNEFSRP